MTATPDISQQIIHGGRGQALWAASVIADVFGISSPIYLPWGKAAAFPPSEYPVVEVADAEDSLDRSAFGLPVLGSITFDGGSYKMYDKTSGRVNDVIYGRYTLPYSCIVDFSRESNIITTNVMGNTGTVKELYGLGDWDINIRGIAVNGIDGVKNSAREQIKHLTAWADLNDAIGVTGDLFADKDIQRIVIKSINIQPLEGKYNVIPFQIEAISDEALELYL